MALSRNLRGSDLRRRYQDEELDPSSGLANLADCMLVLACGLMVALVVAWNIDITTVTEVVPTPDAQEISDIESITGDLESGGSAYIDMGKVYQDPETGKLFMVESSDEAEEQGEAGPDGGEGDADE